MPISDPRPLDLITRRAAVVAHARSWIGTPYRIHQRRRGVAVDCGWLIVKTGWAESVLPMTEEEFAPFAATYGNVPNGNHVRAILDRYFVPIAEGEVDDGDIAWMTFDPGRFQNSAAVPWGVHFAILATAPDGRRTMIHASGDEDRVLEHGFAGEWPARVVSFWRYPGLV